MAKHLKVIILANAFYNGGKNFWGGGDSRCFNIINRFPEDRFVFCVMSNHDGIRVYSRNIKHKFEKILQSSLFGNLYLDYAWRSLSGTFRLWRSLKLPLKEKVLIYSTSDFFPDVLPPFFLKNKNRRWIQVIHHLYPDPRKREGSYFRNFIAYWLQKFSFFLIKKRADKIVVVNPLVKEALINFGIEEKRILSSSNGIDLNYFHQIKPNKKYDGLFLGRLNRSKGVFDLPEIWKHVCEKVPKAKLAVLGEGDDNMVKALKKKIAEGGLTDRIDILGFMENDEAFSLLKGSKLFIFPSHEEGFGIVLAEAGACNVPAVAWNLPVYKAVFGSSICTARRDSFEEFANIAITLLLDEVRRSEVGNKVAQFITRYSWDEVANVERSMMMNLLLP
ncbi:MAG TPA: glycosyltransferase [bacterium]|nr:glycosyltransferase [bacterium]